MAQKKQVIKKIFPVCLVMVLMLAVFAVFIGANKRRIVAQNAQYVEDVARQTASRTDTVLDYARESICLVADLYGNALKSTDVDLDVLRQMEEHTSFDQIAYAGRDGIGYTLDGSKKDVSDRIYFINGMEGENGVEVVPGQGTDEENLVVFYAPVCYRRKIIGVVFGIYQEETISRTLETYFFGKQAATFLCLPDGRVVASAAGKLQVDNILDASRQTGKTAGDGMTALEHAFQELGSVGISFEDASGPGVAHVACLPGLQWMLVQAFPSGTTSQMLQEANGAGVRLEAELLLIVAAYIGYLLVNARKKRQMLLREKDVKLEYNEQLFNLLVRDTGDIFVLFSGEDYRAEYVSPNVERILGMAQQEVAADVRRLFSSAAEDRSRFLEEIMGQQQEAGAQPVACELSYRISGELCWYQATLYRVAIQDTEKYLMTLSDRTAERQANQALRQALDAATSANQAKSSFLSNMSHDIRTPMNAIVGFSMLLAKEAEHPDKVREYTRKITASSQHLLGLINDVLDMSKIESGKTALNIAPFQLSELMEELSAIIMPQAKAKQQAFELRTQGTLPEQLLGDKMRVSQILLNILSNAVKYTQNEGRIELVVRNLERNSPNYARVCFEVSDNGRGMSGEFLETIFDPFTREGNTTASGIQGTGLGMAITKNLVSLMGGTIEVKSRPGEGSTFTVAMEFALPKQLRDDHFWEHHGITRVLVVDDEEEVCLQIREVMKETGVQVECALSGREAIGMVKSAHESGEDYPVILLDWKMPDMDGIETASRIRGIVGAEVTILVLTSYDWCEIESEAKEAGIDRFLAKPFFISSFQQTILQHKQEKLEPAREEPTEAAGQESLSGIHFLVAEDNELNAEILTEMLAMEGATCQITPNGKEALEAFSKSEPGTYDMILMDVQMPVMNGYDAARAIRRCGHPEAETIPIVAMTANAFAQDVHDALKAGMDAHVAKPVDLEILCSTLLRLKKK